jgi:hypothetical protein
MRSGKEWSQKYRLPIPMTARIKKMIDPVNNTSVSPGAVMNEGI